MLTEGMYVADRYEIIGKTGTGGMSDVYKAKDLTLGRFVAIKVLKSEFSEDMNFVTKFRTEAQSAAGLEHPNIVNIYDVGSEHGMHYIVMEFVEGVTLKTYIEKKIQLTFKEAVSIAIQVGRGIEAAHSKNIIHRDIKPQNIIISTEGKVKVTDFGIARAASANTISSDVMGSVHYSSPEQARNGFVDGKSDIYSLGIVMYEMVTGRVPFNGDTTVAVAIQHLQEEMVAPGAYAPNLPVSMEKIILKCTQKNPDRRYESVSALLADLRKALISPDEDFVVMVPVSNQDKTRIIRDEDVRQIKKETGNIYLKPGDYDSRREEESYSRRDEEEEDEEDDGELNPGMEKAITIMGIAAAVVIVAIIAVLLLNLLGVFNAKGKDTADDKGTDTQSSQTEEDKSSEQGSSQVSQDVPNDQTGADADADMDASKLIPVPSLGGKTYEEAERELEKIGLGIRNRGEVSSDEYEEGTVASQDPVAGESVAENTVIDVVLSNGKGSIEVPDVKGKKEADAVAALREKDFKENKTYAYSETVEEGYVIAQDPAGGTSGKKGDLITIQISQGREAVTVPDVKTTYKSEEQAREILKDFSVTVNGAFHDTIPEGIVTDQSIPAGSRGEKGTAITITVSKGPAPSQSQVVQTATYTASFYIALPGNTEGIAGADVVLYDMSGNVLHQWLNQMVGDFDREGRLKLTKSGLLVERGEVTVTWLDEDGEEVGTKTDTIEFRKDS